MEQTSQIPCHRCPVKVLNQVSCLIKNQYEQNEYQEADLHRPSAAIDPLNNSLKMNVRSGPSKHEEGARISLRLKPRGYQSNLTRPLFLRSN